MAVTIRHAQEMSVERSKQFKNKQGEVAHPPGREWTPADWMVATVGELGELANQMKKIKRGDYAANQYPEARHNLKDELGDVLAYLFLLADSMNVNLEDAFVRKFNEVSDKQQLDFKL